LKILVTGASGLLGSALCPLARDAGHDVRAMVRSTSGTDHMDTAGIEVVTANLLEPASLAAAADGVDCVVHAAASLPGRDEEAVRRVNVDGTYALLDAVTQGSRRARFIHVSSLTAGGFGTSQHPLREDMIPRPATTYGRTRLEAEEVVRGHASRMDCTILRLSMLYGPRDRLLPPLYRLVAFGLTPLPEGGDMELSLLHAEDAAAAIVRVLEDGGLERGTYYVADDRPTSWKKLCGAIQAALGRSVSIPVRLERGALVGARRVLERLDVLPAGLERRIPASLCPDLARLLLGRGLVCDGSRFRSATGWSPRHDLAHGMRRTIAWLRNRDLL
jgi:nucleoside-diphosphate-sugar epimerase